MTEEEMVEGVGVPDPVVKEGFPSEGFRDSVSEEPDDEWA